MTLLKKLRHFVELHLDPAAGTWDPCRQMKQPSPRRGPTHSCRVMAKYPEVRGNTGSQSCGLLTAMKCRMIRNEMGAAKPSSLLFQHTPPSIYLSSKYGNGKLAQPQVTSAIACSPLVCHSHVQLRKYEKPMVYRWEYRCIHHWGHLIRCCRS